MEISPQATSQITGCQRRAGPNEIISYGRPIPALLPVLAQPKNLAPVPGLTIGIQIYLTSCVSAYLLMACSNTEESFIHKVSFLFKKEAAVTFNFSFSSPNSSFDS